MKAGQRKNGHRVGRLWKMVVNRGWTLQRLADACGAASASVAHQWVTGECMPRETTKKRLARVMGVPLGKIEHLLNSARAEFKRNAEVKP